MIDAQDVGASALEDLGLRAWHDACRAPAQIANRFATAVSMTVADKEQLSFARVRMQRSHRFDLDEAGRWWAFAPVFNGGEIVDVAGFDFDDPDQRAGWRGYPAGVGLDRALDDARWHLGRRLRVHFDFWSWLRADCIGALPVDWRQFALLVSANDLEIDADDDEQRRKIDRRLRAALKPPAIFVRRTA